MSGMDRIDEITVATYPGVESRLLGPAARESGDEYLRARGYATLRDPESLHAAIGAAGVRGRGGAAFPLARKIGTVRSGAVAPVLVANGEEGEPTSVKDRWLMRHRPHLVLDGVRLAAAMISAQQIYLYISDPASAESMTTALTEFPAEGWNEVDIRIHKVEPSYVAGEETAAVRSINGGPPLPQDKPPRPFESGVDNRPTMVSNVETLANLPFVLRHGPDAYRALGTEDSPGTFLLTLTGVPDVGLYEVPFGTTLREVLAWRGLDGSRVTGALVGGYFAGLLTDRVLDIPLEYGSMAAAGSGLGCGAISVIDLETCPVTVAADVLAYFDRVNAGQCGSCFNGTAAMAAVTRAVCEGEAEAEDVERLRRWSVTLRGRGACGTLDGATNVAASVLREFGSLITAYLEGARAARDTPVAPVPFAVVENLEETPA